MAQHSGDDFEYIKQSVDAGVAPLELRFVPIVNPESGFPVAYRLRPVIRSVLLGELQPEDYTSASDTHPIGLALLRHTLHRAVAALERFDQAGQSVAFLSIRCPAPLVETEDLHGQLSHFLSLYPALDPSRLCLEFPASLMERQTDKAQNAVRDVRLLKIRTAVTGFGAQDFPTAKLLTVCPDIVFLDPNATAYAGSRNKPQLLPALVNLAGAMRISAIAVGTQAQRKAMRGTDCIGFVHTDGVTLSLDEALALKEEH